MSIYHCDDCRFLHSQCKCPDPGPPWYPNRTHKENARIRDEWFRKNTERGEHRREEER